MLFKVDVSNTRTAIRVAICTLFICAVVNIGLAQTESQAPLSQPSASNSTDPTREWTIKPIRTESPRQTFESFLRVSNELEVAAILYQQQKSWLLFRHITTLSEQLSALVDVSEVAGASRRDVGFRTICYLMDIFGRIELPNLEDVPDVDDVKETEQPSNWRVPHTPLRIVQIGAGAREGEFLFSSRTTTASRRFFKGIEELPLRSKLKIQSWSNYVPQLTGPALPSALTNNMPKVLLTLWFDTPIWKIVYTAIIFLLAFLVIVWTDKVAVWLGGESKLNAAVIANISPISALLLLSLVQPLVANQLNVWGRFSTFTEVGFVTTKYLLLAWFAWQLSSLFFERLMSANKVNEGGVDANLFRLAAKVTGIVVVVLVLAYGGQQLGLPVLSLLAGLGIGGIAIALAIRPTLENLIGGVILYIDKPVRVGDFCSFGSYTGTVETIGMRSTNIRATDRTLISIPNAKFADMELINWAQCDRMLISQLIGVRYETTPDQLRHILVNLREMFHAHPRIDSETIRVRFASHGASSLDISIRVYALTREWNDFHAIKEDVLLRVSDIVAESGSGFAFPSQTLYIGQDDGLDKSLGDKAEKEVKSWRRHRKLPFPRLSSQRIQELEDTLDYPPNGSVELASNFTSLVESEALSTEPLSEEPLSIDEMSKTDDERQESSEKK